MRVTGKHVYLSLLMVFCKEEYNNNMFGNAMQIMFLKN
jgi:hypothetical protein